MTPQIPQDRPTRVFRQRLSFTLPADPNLATPIAIYRSPVLALNGSTLVNAFVSVRVLADSAPLSAIRMVARITDDVGGMVSNQGTSVADTQGGILGAGYRGRGQYDGGVIGPIDTLSGGIRWAIFGVSEHVRDMEIDIDGVLVCGGGRDRG